METNPRIIIVWVSSDYQMARGFIAVVSRVPVQSVTLNIVCVLIEVNQIIFDINFTTMGRGKLHTNYGP